MVDCFNGGVITDYKVTSAWSIVYGSRVEHWSQQLNLYAHLLRENGLVVEKIQIVTFLRDWDRNKAKQDCMYPQAPLLIIPMPLWTIEKCEEYIEARLQVHIISEDLPDDALLPCSKEDCWERPSTWAVMKEGGKRAVRVLETRDLAYTYLGENFKTDLIDKGKVFVTERCGTRIRCSDYCSLAPFCHQHKLYLDCLNS